MTRPPLLPLGSRRISRRWLAAAVAVTTALGVGTGPLTPAVSAPDPDCPAAFPVADLVEGQPVNGLSVSRGVTPDPFTGEVVGVLENGVMPGRDMIMVDLTSPEIDRVGIWFGMSGSPVYAADGRLIGAVAFGLSWGASTIAGLTPAADMHELLASPPPERRAPEDVAIPRRLGKELVEEDLATRAQVRAGLTRLELPFAINGLPDKRLAKVTRKLDLDLGGLRTSSLATTASLGVDDLVPGGNVAAAISVGDITAAGVGTATAVCGGEVLGFGHPFQWSGPTTLSLHAASALLVHDDPPNAGFKLANIDPTALGTVTEDRMAGILGEVGSGPRTAEVTSTVSGEGKPARDGATSIALEDWVPDLAFIHLLANHDSEFDGFGEGVADVAWTITGTREDGSPFTVSRDDVFANKYDISFSSAWDLLMVLYLLDENGIEDIRIDAVDAVSDLDRGFDSYVFKKAHVKQGRGPWTKITRRDAVFLRAGKPAKFRVTVKSKESGVLRTVRKLKVPRAAKGRSGSVAIYGGSDSGFPGAALKGTKTLDDVLTALEDAPRNDHIVVNLSFRRLPGAEVERRSRTGTVVRGGLEVPLFVR